MTADELLDDLDERLARGMHALQLQAGAPLLDNHEYVRLHAKTDALGVVRDWLRSYR